MCLFSQPKAHRLWPIYTHKTTSRNIVLRVCILECFDHLTVSFQEAGETGNDPQPFIAVQ